MISFFMTLIRFVRVIIRALKDPEFKGLFIFVMLLLLSGTFFYASVEHWRVLDSLYFSVTTLTTIGFGDFAPHTDIGKIFTIIYVFVGLGTILGFLNVLAKHMTMKPEKKEEKPNESQDAGN